MILTHCPPERPWDEYFIKFADTHGWELHHENLMATVKEESYEECRRRD